MLIRIRGGRKGIAQYLKTGRKKGRSQTRDELDERVVLYGDLDVIDRAIEGIAGKGDKYLHIVLAFREDQVDSQVLRTIAGQFRDFALAAYQDGEGLFYAEAHLPRIKTLVAADTGETYERFPHIHVVLPNLNLLTGKGLRPFGKVLRQIPYIDAFQEVANANFGLASPKEHARVDLSNRSHVLARLTGTLFPGPGQELKAAILEQILKTDLCTLEDLERHLKTLGEVRTRNAETEHPYLNLKVPGAAKGVNLKEFPFTREFLALSPQEKQARLGVSTDPRPYLTPGPARVVDSAAASRLKEWFDLRAREVKYLNSGNRTAWKDYQAQSPVRKHQILKELERKFYSPAVEEPPPEPVPETPPPSARPISVPKPLLVRPNSALGQRVVEEVNRVFDQALASRLVRPANGLSVATLLVGLKSNYGVEAHKNGQLLEKASTQGPVGLYRFLRTELHLAPLTALRTLRRYGVPTSRPIPVVPDREAYARLSAEFRLRKKRIEEDVRLSAARRKEELSVAHMSLVLSRQHLWAQLQQARTREMAWAPREEIGNFLSAPGSGGSGPFVPAEQKAANWTHYSDDEGNVQYLRRNQKVCLDVGQKIYVQALDNEALAIVLKLAFAKWGPRLELFGDEDFKHRTVRQAARMSLKIEFVDPALQRVYLAQRDSRGY